MRPLRLPLALLIFGALTIACADPPTMEERPRVGAVVTDETFGLLPDVEVATIQRFDDLDGLIADLGEGHLAGAIVDRRVYADADEATITQLRRSARLLIGIDIQGNELSAGRLDDPRRGLGGFGDDPYSYFGWSSHTQQPQRTASGYGSLPRYPEDRFRGLLNRVIEQHLANTRVTAEASPPS